jgi:hypothetical protein
MYIIYPNIADYEHVEIDSNSMLFHVQKEDGDTVKITIDTTSSREQLALGGTLEAYNSDVIGHLIYALEST